MRLNTIYNEDCLVGMQRIPDGSVDMILCDLPYGTTACKWDSVIPFEPLWAQYKRIAKKNAAIVLTASQPFTSRLVCSNEAWFKYSLVYEKSHSTGHLNANRMPMRKHEDVLVFASAAPTYNAQKQPKPTANIRPGKRGATATKCYGGFDPTAPRTDADGISFPISIVRFANSTTGGDKGLHPTQKPVALFEYLIRTYTNEGETVLDNCMGSGTTAIACLNTGRHYLGFEKDPGYCDIAQQRIRNHQPALKAAA